MSGVDDEVLLAVFRFKSRRPSAIQTEEFCKRVRDALGECVAVVTTNGDQKESTGLRPAQHLDPLQDDRATPLHEFTPDECAWLTRGWRELFNHSTQKLGAVWTLAWFPQYAGVLQAEQLGIDVVALRVVALDNWALTRHFLPSGECVHSAVSTRHVLLSCGSVPTSSLPEFKQNLAEILGAAKQCTGSQRSAFFSNEKSAGHQKTPQFLVASVRTALGKLAAGTQSPHAPRGGMTDVGQHTGGAPRDTCWPLVCAALRQSLPAHSVLADKLVLMWHRRLVGVAIEDLAGCRHSMERFWRQVDTCFEMLEVLAIHVTQLVDQGYDGTQWLKISQQCRDTLDAAVSAWNVAHANLYRLPLGMAKRQLPTLLPPDQTPFADLVDTNGSEDLSYLKLGRAYEFPNASAISLTDLVAVLKSVTPQDDAKSLLGRRAVENFMLEVSACLATSSELPEDIIPERLVQLMTWYRDHLNAEHSHGDDCKRVQQRSVYLLLSWVAFCAAHMHCCKTFAAVAQFKIVLDWQRLEVCVLKERRARDALQRVVRYIHDWNRVATGSALFDLSDQAGTLALARVMGEARHQDTYERIQKQWHASCAATWTRILERKEKLSAVRAEIQANEAKLQEAKDKLDAELEWLRRHEPYITGNGLTKMMRKDIRRLSHELHQAVARRNQLQHKPELLVSPFPRAKADALQVLFLVEPPRDIDLLAELCWRAQRALCSSPSSASIASSLPGFTTWRKHVEEYGGVKFSQPAQHAIAYPATLAVPRFFGPASIDDVSSLECFMSSSTWYPTATDSSVAWRNDGQWVNPFKIRVSTLREDFTARLRQSGGSFNWQWSLEYPDDTALTRGNMTYAHWNTSEDGADKDAGIREFCSRGALRAYPYQQLRHIFADIEADSLSWSDPTVSVLVRHALYQVGELSALPTVDEDGLGLTSVRLNWHVDLEIANAVDELCAIAARLVAELSHSPRRWRCVPLVGEIVAFLAQFSTRPGILTKSLARMTRRWAEEVRHAWQRDGVADDERKALRLRECVLYGYAALCYDRIGSGPDDDDDEAILERSELLVLFHNAKLFASGEKVAQIQAKVDCMMADRVARTVEYVQTNPHMLTQLCRLVNTSVPPTLTWFVVPAAKQLLHSCLFTALDKATQTRYTVNLYTGAVTTNGGLPSGLPASIRSLLMYRQLFQDRDFEVTHRGKVYTATTHNLQSRRYAFRVDERSSELLVEEAGPVATLQSCSDEWRDRFATQFPRRLVELYSHWYWIDRRVVLLRPPLAKDTDVHFVLGLEADGAARCYEVPRSERSLPYDCLVQRVSHYPVLVTADPQVLQVFSKLEDNEFIHAMELPTLSQPLEVQLPRFGLRFTQTTHGTFASVEHRGFQLSHLQQLDSGQMPRFSQYLVLERKSPDAQRRLILPVGPVKCSESGSVTVEMPSEASASIASVAIDEHIRLRVFAPSTLEAQLQLAAIYAASDSLVPWKDLGMTGGEAALRLLRGCTPSRPWSTCATTYLEAIATPFAFRAPVLTLMVFLLLEKSSRLAFLFGLPTELKRSVNIADALDEYRHRVGCCASARVYPRRQLLTLAEERDLLHSNSAVETMHAKTYSVSTTLDEHCVITNDSGLSASEALCTLVSSCVVTSNQPATPTIPPFPLSPRGSNTMSKCMLDELRESWDAFHRHNSWTSLSASRDAFKMRVRDSLTKVQAKRKQAFDVLCQSLALARDSVHDKLLNVIGRYATLTLADVMQSVLDDHVLLQLSPRFTALSRQRWKEWSLLLLELCVMEDKLERLLLYDSNDKILEELQTVKRAWKSSEHPYWLVFEVEGRLEIRHEQFVIAKHLIDNPGSICQLNMGRGKTRVILPMLFLHYSYHARSSRSPTGRIVRAHFLSPLLSETREFMWRVLSAGVLAMPFIELPFNRSLSLGQRELRLMGHVLEEAKRNGGVVMVAPEHRLSLELKRVEIASAKQNVTPTLLDAVLDPSNFVDIFDESDALLHHGYHLVYAVGDSVALDGGSDRWLMAEALLRVLMSDTSARVKAVLRQYQDMWSLQPEYRDRRGGTSGGGIFNGFRLNAAAADDAEDEKADAADVEPRAALRRALVEDLIDHAPFDCEWLRFFAAARCHTRDQLIRVLIDPTIDLSVALARLPPVLSHRKHQVLALRGLLAFCVLDNCLEKRYRVEYGHPTRGSRPKAIAIPFQAADLPSERSEFSHPDVGIVLTLLSFYHSGLRDDQLRRTFEVLLELDEAESERYYAEWFTSIAASLEDSVEREMLASLQHISLDNAHQFAAVCKVYRFAIEVVNFYLNFCVFPNDTRQFPSRLSRSAWDLVRSATNIGFSGTNDTHHLLPLAVKQREPQEPALQGTNGKMVQLLMDATRGYAQLQANQIEAHANKATVACWQALLLLALEKQCHALIDTGALLAGVANHDAAQFLITQPRFAAQGVTYYDTRALWDGWVVLEKDRNVVQRQKNAPLAERDTFVIFDEARARGSDMKLLPTAMALLTLGPKITKDKLMQGAGRLRQLGKYQQTLWITSTLDVYKSMLRQSPNRTRVTLVQILNWVMNNTQRQCTLGRLEWAQSGIQFHAKEADAKCEQQDDDWTLEGQYAGAQTVQTIAEIIHLKLSAQAEIVVAPQASVETAWSEIGRCGELFGRQDKVAVSGFGEECERELQIEEEQQQERQVVHRQFKPCNETPWKWQSLQNCLSVEQLQHARIGVEIISVAQAASAWLTPREYSGIAWATAKIFATQNFWHTVQAPTTVGSTTARSSGFTMNACLRRVDAMVVFADASVLLLSEFEADAVLKMLQTARATEAAMPSLRGSFGFVHLTFAVGLLERLQQASPLTVAVSHAPLSLGWSNGQAVVPATLLLPFTAIMVCRLLNGDTDLFGGSHAGESERVLRVLLQPLHHREETLQTFVSLRGFSSRWKRSWLHTITKRMDLEDAAT